MTIISIPQPQKPPLVSKLAFLSRFTDAEAVAIDIASIGATVPAATVRRYLQKVSAAEYIDLSREDTRTGVMALEASGLLSDGRALVILDTPPSELEMYRG